MKTKKMIILEDDKLTQIAYKRMFSDLFELRIFGSADPFFDSINKETCDILIIDISLDGNLNGFEITRMLRNDPKYEHLPIVCITAHAFQKDRVEAIKSGVNDVIIKPTAKEELLTVINRYV